MKLAAYLETNGISYAEFARRIGAHNARTAERYAKGQRVPAGRLMAEIVRETKGEVQPNDFFEVEPVAAAA